MRVGRTGGVGPWSSGSLGAGAGSVGRREASPSSLSGRWSGNPPGRAGPIQPEGWMRPLRLTVGTPKRNSRCA
eukprot:3311950-Pyramimonas_sp.AAC.2